MNARYFPSAVLTAATLALVVRLANPAAAQEAAAPSSAPSSPATSTAAVWLSSGAEEILKLTRAKINDDVTIAFVQYNGRRFNLTASDIVYLRKEGVSDRVLTTMLTSDSQPPPAPQSPPPVAPAEASVASAPEYVTPPTSTTYVETAPASTRAASQSVPRA